MKKIIAIIMSLMIITSCTGGASAISKPNTNKAEKNYTVARKGDKEKLNDGGWYRTHMGVVTKPLYLRDKPNGKILCVIPKGTKCVDLGNAPIGWARVKYGKKYGVCGSRYLAPVRGAEICWTITEGKVKAYYDEKQKDFARYLPENELIKVVGHCTRFEYMEAVIYKGNYYFVDCHRLFYFPEKPDKIVFKKRTKLYNVITNKLIGVANKGDKMYWDRYTDVCYRSYSGHIQTIWWGRPN